MIQTIYGFQAETLDPDFMLLEYIGWSTVTDPSYDWLNWQRKERSACFQYTISGQGTLQLDGKSYAITPGVGFFVEFPGPHRYFFDPDKSDHWEFIWIQASGNAAALFWRQIQRLLGTIVEFPRLSEPIQLLERLYMDTAEQGKKDKYLLSCKLYEWLMSILNIAERGKAVNFLTADRMEAVKSYIDLNLHRDLTLVGLAEFAGFTPSYFSRLFHQLEGLPPVVYLHRRRMEEAVKLLRHTDYSVGEIAARLGYDNANYFAKVFRKHLSCSPSSFRRQRLDPFQTDIIYL
ncbi:MAG: helix-turn-helix transcriptional regulator [Gorillibacterium sp.]|nr:helix-turn-helix transcriptional regulator [Gorillibacterium sp.]